MSTLERLTETESHAATATGTHARSEPRTLVEMFGKAARIHPKPDALNYKQNGQWHKVSTEEAKRRAKRVALGLYALGIRRGDRVAILSENCIEWTLADRGCLTLGAIDVPIYSTQTPAQVCYILKDSGARVLFIQNKAAYERVAEAIRDCSQLEHIVFFHGEVETTERYLSLAELETRGETLDEGRPELADDLARAVRPEDLATIIYTSGTTGDPKGVMLTHSNLVSNLIDSSAHLGFNERDVVLSVLPLSHIFERGAMYMYAYHGMTVYFAESLDRLADNMREVRPTILIAVPRLFEKIYARIKERAASEGRAKSAILSWAVEVGKQHAERALRRERVSPLLRVKYGIASRLVFSKWRAGVGGRIRIFISGGAALPEEIGWIFAGAGLPILQGYGLTETSPVITTSRLEDNRIGTVGRPIKNVEVRIAEDGEIEVRGPNVMRGYYNKPEETAKVFTSDGWFKTGDIGSLDEDGFLRITDRKKELFKTSGGKYISPQLIEGRIKRSRFVAQTVLIGDGRRFPAALIVPDFNQLRSYAQIKNLADLKPDCAPAEFCSHPRIINLFERQIETANAELAQFERVKKFALLERELTIEGGELTPTLKVKRRVVNEKYRDVIEKMYEESEVGS
jgi:long-chain acyl-CoA synthetase